MALLAECNHSSIKVYKHVAPPEQSRPNGPSRLLTDAVDFTHPRTQVATATEGCVHAHSILDN